MLGQLLVSNAVASPHAASTASLDAHQYAQRAEITRANLVQWYGGRCSYCKYCTDPVHDQKPNS
jgi:hypothetical protein